MPEWDTIKAYLVIGFLIFLAYLIIPDGQPTYEEDCSQVNAAYICETP